MGDMRTRYAQIMIWVSVVEVLGGICADKFAKEVDFI